MRISSKALEKLKQFEGFRAQAYTPVKGDRLTIGYGFTEGVKPGDTITRKEADVRLAVELKAYEQAVYRACTVEPTQHEFDAMVLLCFNIGIAGFKRSTVLKAHNRGDRQAASRAFGLWNKSSGVVYAGLTRRRAEEAAWYLTPDESAEEELPVTVDPESRMTESPINRAGVVAGGTAAVATVAETARTVADVKYSTQALGDWLVPVLLIVVVALCGYMIWQRVNQRKQGWA